MSGPRKRQLKPPAAEKAPATTPTIASAPEIGSVEFYAHWLLDRYGSAELDEKQVAEVIAVTEAMLQQGRYRGDPSYPPFVKRGGTVRYPVVGVARQLADPSRLRQRTERTERRKPAEAMP